MRHAVHRSRPTIATMAAPLVATAMLMAALMVVGCAGGSSASPEAFCRGLADLVAAAETSDPQAVATSLSELAAIAPSDDLRRATSLLAENYAVFAAIPTGDLEALERAFGAIDEEATNAAVSVIESYGVDECGIDDF